MKSKTPSILAILAIIASISTAVAALPAPLPDFKSPQELTSERQAKTHVSRPLNFTDGFYTGRPFEDSQKSYIYKYRSYDQELSRWVVGDPSGYPDGANNHRYAANPNSQVDYQGLETRNVQYTFITQTAPGTSHSMDAKIDLFATLEADWENGPSIKSPTDGDYVANGGSVSGSKSIAGVTAEWELEASDLKIGTVQTVNIGHRIKKYVFDITWEIKTDITASWAVGAEAGVSAGFFSTSIAVDAAGTSSERRYRFEYTQSSVEIFVAE